MSKIVSYAHANGLEVIPLVQTFGHLEMALKLDEFKMLREAAGHPQVITVKCEKHSLILTSTAACEDVSLNRIFCFLGYLPEPRWVLEADHGRH